MDWDRIFAYGAIIVLLIAVAADLKWNWIGRVIDSINWGYQEKPPKRDRSQPDKIRDVLDYCYLAKHNLVLMQSPGRGWICIICGKRADGASPSMAMACWWDEFLKTDARV